MLKTSRQSLNFSLFAKIVLFAALGITYISILFSPGRSDVGIIFTNFVIIFYSSYRIFFNKRYPYSIHQTFYIIALFFLGIAPLIQYKEGIESVPGYFITESTYLIVNILLIVIFILIDLIYFYKQKQQLTSVNKYKQETIERKDTVLLQIMTLIFSSLSLIYILYINQDNLTGFFLRGGEYISRTEIENSSIRILINTIIRPLPIFAFIYYYKIGSNRLCKVLLFFIALTTCFPSSMPRLMVGAYWIPVMITIFKVFNKKNFFSYVFIGGLAVLFPAFEAFRNFDYFFKYNSISSSLSKLILSIYSGMAYDSYQSFAFVFQNKFITYGQQLLGVLAIFIPRTFWAEKPIGTGFTVARQYGLGYENISMHFFGEGYANFGIIGVFVFAAVLAIIMKYCDSKYWDFKNKEKTRLFPVIYLIFMGILAYIMRGDMMGSFTVTAGTAISASIIYTTVILCTKKIKHNTNNKTKKILRLTLWRNYEKPNFSKCR
ncbi:oligosaccharide repeat unit polymerase [Elusimicrobium posterum]|uniref:O-antigen polymerase n=1 Tax=Elusimicrobium posterum TaxID=3116653 RepID=UPI003C761B09